MKWLHDLQPKVAVAWQLSSCFVAQERNALDEALARHAVPLGAAPPAQSHERGARRAQIGAVLHWAFHVALGCSCQLAAG